MDDERVQGHIEQLVAEEHRLLQAHSEGEGLAPAEHQRLEAIKVQLDRYWDLLRQRRARERAGLDPEDASLRDADTVEKYLQ
jgi:hypothetical protein